MHILWLKMGGLWPLNTGGRQRTFQTISDLSARHDVTVVTTAGPHDDPEGLAASLPRCRRVISVPFAASKQGSARFFRDVVASWCSRYPVDLSRWRPPQMRGLIRELLAGDGARWDAGTTAPGSGIDLIVADFLCGAVNLPPTPGIPVVFFEHNVEYLIWKRLADVEPKAWRRALLEIEWRKMRRCEVRACRQADLTIAVSPDDRDRLAAAAGIEVAAIPTGVDIDYFSPSSTPEVDGRLVFSGSMDWYPNEDAMLFWAESILPKVRRETPNVSLTIVGRNPSAAVRALASQRGIDVTGTVDDVRPHIAEAALYIVPLRVGGGTRLKIFEALAMGKAVLSTTVGAEGLDVNPGEHLVLADGAEAFADQVIALLRDPGRRSALGRAGRQLVEDQFSWPQVARQFERLLEDARARSGRDIRTAGQTAAGSVLDARVGPVKPARATELTTQN